MARYANTEVDLLASACWAWFCKENTGLSFAQLEREFVGKNFAKKDGGGFRQPSVMSRIARVAAALQPGRPDHRMLMSGAERVRPGATALLESISWDELRLAKGERLRVPISATRAAPALLDQLTSDDIELETESRFLLTPQGAFKVGQNWREFDALGLLLMQRRQCPWRTSGAAWISLVRWWLAKATHEIFPLHQIRLRFLKAVECAIPEIAPLVGPDGINASALEIERMEELANLCYASPGASWQSELLSLTVNSLRLPRSAD